MYLSKWPSLNTQSITSGEVQAVRQHLWEKTETGTLRKTMGTLTFWNLTNRKTPKLFMWLPLGRINISAFHLYCNYYYYVGKKKEGHADIRKCKININLREAENTDFNLHQLRLNETHASITRYQASLRSCL